MKMKFRKIITGTFLVAGGFFAAALSFELVSDIANATANPEMYRFGSDAMVANGGAHFASLTDYVNSGAHKAVFIAGLAGAMIAIGAVLLYLSLNTDAPMASSAPRSHSPCGGISSP